MPDTARCSSSSRRDAPGPRGGWRACSHTSRARSATAARDARRRRRAPRARRAVPDRAGSRLVLVRGKRVVGRLDGRASAPKIERCSSQHLAEARRRRPSLLAAARSPRGRTRPRARRRRRGGRTSRRRCPIRRTTISPSRTTGRSAIRWMPRIATSGWLTSGVTKRPAELAGARHGERPAAQLLRRELAGARGLGEPPHLGVELVERARVAVADDRDDEALLGLHRDADVVAVEVARSRRRRVARSARGTPAARGDRLQHAAAASSFRSTSAKSHSSTQVTGGISRCARVMCSNICRRIAADRLAPLSAPAPRGRRAPRTSASVIRPCGPVPATAARSTPSSCAIRRTSGVARTFSRRARGGGRRGGSTAPGARPAAPSPPITTSTVPTGTTSPSATRIRATTPAAGDGISTVVLSVAISTSGSSSAISWPSATSQRATSPSVRPSPRSGSLNSYATRRIPT